MSVEVLKIKELSVPVYLHTEKRNSARASILKDKIIIRIPNHLDTDKFEESKNKMLEWALKKTSKSDFFLPPTQDRFEHNAVVNAYDEEWKVVVHHRLEKTIEIRLEHPVLKLSYPEGSRISKQMSVLLSKAFSNYYLPKLVKEVNEINQTFFKEDLGKISIKYTNSRWGSCSSKRNLNFSSRLLLVPTKVRRYVIVHELAHLREMNHSERFWKIVEKAMPDYKIYDKWLTKNARQYDF